MDDGKMEVHNLIKNMDDEAEMADHAMDPHYLGSSD